MRLLQSSKLYLLNAFQISPMLLFLLDVIPAELGRDLGVGGTLLVVIYLFYKNFQEVLKSNTDLITTIQNGNNKNLQEINHAITQIAKALDNIQEEQNEISKRLSKIEKKHEEQN